MSDFLVPKLSLGTRKSQLFQVGSFNFEPLASGVWVKFPGHDLGIVLEENQGFMFNRPLLPVTFGFNRFQGLYIVTRDPGQALKMIMQRGHIRDKNSRFPF
jgi:hypothetical protein